MACHEVLTLKSPKESWEQDVFICMIEHQVVQLFLQ